MKRINILIVDSDIDSCNKLIALFKEFRLNCFRYKQGSLLQQIQDTQLIFYNIGQEESEEFKLLYKNDLRSYYLVCTSMLKEHAYEAYQIKASGFLLKPIKRSEVINLLGEVVSKTIGEDLQEEEQNRPDRLIGIPKVDGFDFIPVDSIIRCEGLQSYTRIILEDSNDIITSNNIGKVRKKLAKYGFFSPHKSYIINLSKIIRYSREGVIILNDQSQVPLARRRKDAFFKKFVTL